MQTRLRLWVASEIPRAISSIVSRYFWRISNCKSLPVQNTVDIEGYIDNNPHFSFKAEIQIWIYSQTNNKMQISRKKKKTEIGKEMFNYKNPRTAKSFNSRKMVWGLSTFLMQSDKSWRMCFPSSLVAKI